ncbi:MAG: MoxR-like ATPase [Candidatus Ozemobacter sibiricus]|uniref:MoxR-like ATPase n=1 Tax=Candidatus Ozemobacter sibiricus TaxID=2268124 RepID=A0A367ZLX9_9BACT|nr:MAG: MoxR-like ATPase [Candidatus Ozemobacter sibiricus]
MVDVSRVRDIFAGLKREIQKVIVGQETAIDLILSAILIRGHVLLEGVPGTAKTLTVKSLAQTVQAGFQRIQMTPDLMPSDVLGTNMFDARTGTFQVHKGPIFSDLVLVDEINRAPAKTQSALLECMEERQVTIEGNRFPLSPIFTVLATQNPLEYEGTYPLPEAQLDRFIFKVLIDYPQASEENKILEKFEAGFRADKLTEAGLTPVTTPDEILACQEVVKQVKTKPTIIDYITQITRATRDSPDIQVGGGVRSSIGLFLASKAVALIDGRDFVTPDDVKKMVAPVLRHRIILKPEAEIEGVTPDEALNAIVTQIKVPR